MSPRPLTIGSLCTGYGGLDMAVEEVFGGETIWTADLNPAAAKIIEHRWAVPNYGDIKLTHWGRVPKVDIITAGYPCQPFSHAGRRNGIDDPRHLWPFVAQAVRRVRPRYVVLENVAGHRSLGFGAVLADLAALRYVGSWVSLRASDVGACHGRDRVFILAADADSPGREGREPARRHDVSDGGAPADTEDIGHQRAGTARGRRDGSTDSGHSATYARGDRRDRDAELDSSAVTRVDGEHRGHADGRGNGTDWGPYTRAVRRWERVTGRVAPHPTEPATRGGERLSPPFVEWMQGLPAGFVTEVPGLSRNDQLRALGNGVVRQQAAEALRRLLPLIATERAA